MSPIEMNESQVINVTRWLQYIRGTASPKQPAPINLVEAGQRHLEEDYDGLWFHRNKGMLGRIDCSIIICGAAAIVLVITIISFLRFGVE